MEQTEQDHARLNALAQRERIESGLRAQHALYAGADTVQWDGETFDEGDLLQERLQEIPLSVEVRTGWYDPAGEQAQPSEYCLLLTTGGPACRIVGDLDDDGQPTSAQLQHQDWGTPWATIHEATGGDDLVAFAALFLF